MNPYKSQTKPSDILSKPILWFVFHDDQLLLQCTQNQINIPLIPNVPCIQPHISQQLYLGTFNHIHCVAAQISELPIDLPENMMFQPIRQSHETLANEATFQMVSRAKQLLHWDRTTKFCGTCGHINELSEQEQAKSCPACKQMVFPQIAPAILVLIWRKNEILLARSPQFMPEIYSVLAGFVEPGETIEQTVIREVKEEVGINIKNLQYYASQPWPFPSSLMLGFVAEYDSGELMFDTIELEDAQWFPLNKLPKLPKPISLSRLMVDDYVAKYLK